MTYSDQELAKLKSEVNVGREVAALIENETVKGVMNGLLHGIQNAWMKCENREERETLWQQVQGVQLFVGALGSVVDTGKMAAHQLAAEAALKGEDDE